MSLDYSVQNSGVIIGSKNATTLARTPVTLTNAYDNATTTKTFFYWWHVKIKRRYFVHNGCNRDI